MFTASQPTSRNRRRHWRRDTTDNGEKRGMKKSSVHRALARRRSCVRDDWRRLAGGSATKADSSAAPAATFVFPLISQWQKDYRVEDGRHTSTTTRSAPAAGSRRSRPGTVDFGASDAPLTPDQCAACKGCVQIPWALVGDVGHVQPARASPDNLKLTGPVLANIYLGNIKQWNARRSRS